MRSKVSVEREAAIILKHFIIIYFLILTLILMLYLNLSELDTTLVGGGGGSEKLLLLRVAISFILGCNLLTDCQGPQNIGGKLTKTPKRSNM